MKKAFYNLIRIIVSVSLLLLLFWFMRDSLNDIIRTLISANKAVFLLGTLVNILIVYIMGLRLKYIFKAQEIILTLREAVYLTFIGYFFNNFLPSSIGGDIVKAYYAADKTKKKLQSYTSVFIDRMIGMFGLGFIASVALVLLAVLEREVENVMLAWFILAFILASAFICLVLWNRNFAKRFKFLIKVLRISHVEEKLKKIYDAIHGYKNKKKIMLGSFGLSLGAQVLSIVLVFLMALCISVKTNIFNFFLVVPIAGFASILPSINGLGVREGAFVYFLRGMITPEKAFAVSLLWLFQSFILSFIGGIIYLFKGQFKIKSAKEEMYA